MKSSMTVASKLSWLIGLSLLGLAGMALLANHQIQQVFAAANFANANSVPALIAVNGGMKSFGQVRVRLFRYVLNEDPAKFAKLEQELDESRQGLTAAFKAYEPTLVDADDRRLFDTEQTTWRQYEAQIPELLAVARKGDKKLAREALDRLTAPGRTLQAALEAHAQYNADLAAKAAAEAAAFQANALWQTWAGVLLTALGVGGLGWFIARGVMGQLGGEPERAAAVARRIANGELDAQIPLRPGDSASLMAAMRRMQEQLRGQIEAERRAAEAMARVKLALDNASNGVLIADAGHSVIYANQAARRMFDEARADIQARWPGFAAADLLGSRIDGLLADSGMGGNALGTLDGTRRAGLAFGERRWAVACDPVLSEAGERLGLVAEFHDRTAEVAVEQEVERIIDAAAHGDFERRLALAGKQGFLESLARGINRLLETSAGGLADLTRVLDALSEGDLTRRMEADYQGTLGRLKDDTNATVERLRSVVGRIKVASEAIHTAAREIAAGNQDLSRRTEEEAASLDQTASAMAELSATVQQNADNARQANELARSADAAAARGGAMVQQVVRTMEDIQASSGKIADIIGVIDGIAFQTNILALNAAVEAARAGEQGRGFAVVATEVRALAQRSAQAAREIKALIADTVDQVENGGKLVHQAGAAVEEVVGSFQRVAGLVTGISDASREQSKGIQQIAQAVEQMDETTQRNAALVEEAAAAAASLEDQAGGLIEAVGSFRLA